ncbi:MAG: hypothetical protein M3017_02215, partial [Actinomycetota bacterium]|nr:hypothetical protein [Actinomycetota bacterium]
MTSARTKKESAPDTSTPAHPRRGVALLWAAAGLTLTLALGGIFVVALTHPAPGVSPAVSAPTEPGINAAA